jgi:hypothetical protein
MRSANHRFTRGGDPPAALIGRTAASGRTPRL